MFELAMRFLANPCYLWEKGGLQGRQTVLKLAFKGKIAYARNEGFRTTQVSDPFRLFGICSKESHMAGKTGENSNLDCQSRDCGSAGQAAPAEDIARRLSASDKVADRKSADMPFLSV